MVHGQPASEPFTAPEAAAEEVVAPEATPKTNTSLPDPALVPEVVVQDSAAQENAPEPSSTPLPSASLATSGEGAVISNLKNSLLKASEFESHPRELSSQAEVMKTNMHVSTYVSSLTHWV